MPFVVKAVSASMVAAAAGQGIAGQDFPKIADAVASAASSTFTKPSTALVTASGLAGSGTIVPKAAIVGVTADSIALSIKSQMAAQGLVGEKSYNIASAIGKGIAFGLKTLILKGTVAGVGSGAGTGKIINFNNVLFSNTLYMNMASKGLVGKDSLALANAVGNGVCLAINAGGTIPLVTIAGPAGTAPGAAVVPASFS